MKNLLKKYYLLAIRIREEKLPFLFYKSRFFATIYYLFFNSSFDREHYAVLAGKVKHLKDAKRIKANYYMLIRNTHRIEKGLLMRPRRPVFGRAFIEETIDCFEGIWNRDELETNPQMKWFYDVLSEYFAKSGSDTLIEKQHKRFRKKIDNAESTFAAPSQCKSIPYRRDDSDRSNISYEQIYKLSRQRRSVRWFLEKKVPRDLIDKAILVANQSPSACNRQPFEYKIFDDPELVKKVVKLPMGTTGYGHSIPVLMVLIGNLDTYYSERDRHIIYIDASLAAMSFMFALETLGLSSCSINWPDIESREKKMEEFLGLKAHQRPLMCIGLGYHDPEGMVAYSEKRTLTQIRNYN